MCIRLRSGIVILAECNLAQLSNFKNSPISEFRLKKWFQVPKSRFTFVNMMSVSENSFTDTCLSIKLSLALCGSEVEIVMYYQMKPRLKRNRDKERSRVERVWMTRESADREINYFHSTLWSRSWRPVSWCMLLWVGNTTIRYPSALCSQPPHQPQNTIASRASNLSRVVLIRQFRSYGAWSFIDTSTMLWISLGSRQDWRTLRVPEELCGGVTIIGNRSFE